MAASPQLLYFLDRVSGFSTNVFKLMPSGDNSGGNGKITRITLPANALLNTRSFKLFFRAECAAGATGGRLPADISTLVERVEVTAGGVQLSQGTNFYNTLVNAKAAVMGSRCDSVTGHSEMVRANKFDGTSIATTAAETYTAGTVPHCIDKWEGFLGTCEPKILDAAILPDLVVSIYWASDTCLAAVKNVDTNGNFTTVSDTGGATYKVSDIHGTIETIGLADAVYDNMVSSMIAQKGFIEIPFKQYFSFSNSHTGSSRFTVATQSLDRVWMAYRASTFATEAGAHAVPGYSTAAGKDASNLTAALLSDYGGMHGTGAQEKYITKFQKFQEPSTDTKMKYQLQLNGAYYPQFPASREEMYQITKSSLPAPVKYNMTSEQYLDSYFVQCVRLNMPDSEFSRTLSGLDTRSVSMNGYVNTSGGAHPTNDPNLMIFAECTSTLRVGSGRMLEVII